MRQRIFNRRRLGWLLLNLAIFVILTYWIGTSLISRPEITNKRIQKAVMKAEKEMDELIFENAEIAQYEKKNLGLYIFQNDSLKLWNNNAIGPKLIRRKITIGNDTICNLLTGDYYVKSFKKDSLTYYVFKLLNTTYKLENQYFENKFIAFKIPSDNRISFDCCEGNKILSSKGKTLAYSQIEQKQDKAIKEWKPILVFGVILFTIAMLLLCLKPGKVSSFKVEQGIIGIIILSILGTFAYYKWRESIENKRIATLAEKLYEKRDAEFESSFVQFSEQLQNDTALRAMIFSESNVLADVVLGYSKALLFDETMKSYMSALTICHPGEEITVQPEGYVTDCEEYFIDKIANNEKEIIADNLYFIDYNTLDPNYLAKIKIYSTDSLQQKTLYFEFYKPIAPEGFGFPQMLQKDNVQDNNNYSVANYKKGILCYKNGKYIYPNYLRNLKIKHKDFNNENQYKHYSIGEEANNTLIITTKRKGWSEITAPFCVILLVLLLPYLLVYYLLKEKGEQKWKDRSFRQRMQTTVLLTLALAVVTVGPVSVIYMRSLYNQKTTDKQFETTITLINEMKNDLDFNALIKNATRDTWNDILQQYAESFFTDLNLYSLDGRLLATTRQEIYELTLQAPIMNADAYQNMHKNKALYYTHEERLGKGVYASAYIPMIDDNGNAIAYLNTPYFSSNTDLHNEIRNFVLTYINIILVLLGIALVFIIRLTNKLTQPLTLIQSKLGNIKIDQKNEPIEWKRNDEIGALVKQYNLLIAELERSTEELKRTTAESAWRGVARQVAHEIKNSLTPMRLSVQMLQRNVENGKATPEQIQRTTNTLIEQIDALSDIASSFSRYAKLPENNPQPLNLAELVENIVNLYDHEENIAFCLEYDEKKDYTLLADKTNLNSAISNLIKNATQAIGNKLDGKIHINIKAEETQFLIDIKDNGKGIKEEDKKMIFVPNFTTKSGGSGVGLSLTYNIIQSIGGTITFESEEGRGTVFYVRLPR